MFICVLTELSINSEKNNKRSLVKKLSNPIWESIVFLIPQLIKTFTSAFCYLVCVLEALHAHTYKNSHTNKHTGICHWRAKCHYWNVIIWHYRNFIDCLTNKMKCYSTTSNTFGTKTGLFSVYWIFSPSFNFIFSDQFIRNFDCFYTTDSLYVVS